MKLTAKHLLQRSDTCSRQSPTLNNIENFEVFFGEQNAGGGLRF